MGTILNKNRTYVNKQDKLINQSVLKNKKKVDINPMTGVWLPLANF